MIVQKAWAVINTDNKKILSWVDLRNHEQYDVFLKQNGAKNAKEEWEQAGYNCKIMVVQIIGEEK